MWGEGKEKHVARIRGYADDALDVTSELKEASQHAFTQGDFEMATFVDVAEAVEGGGFEVKVDWVGFEDKESSWEPLQTIWEEAFSLSRRSCYRSCCCGSYYC